MMKYDDFFALPDIDGFFFFCSFRKTKAIVFQQHMWNPEVSEHI